MYNTPRSKSLLNFKKWPRPDGTVLSGKNMKNTEWGEGDCVKVSDINKLRKELLERNKDDIVKRMYIERYISFLKIDSKCDADIRKEGTTIWIENASQRFAKTHPSVKTKLDVSSKMERLEELIGIAPTSNSPPGKSAVKKSGLI